MSSYFCYDYFNMHFIGSDSYNCNDTFFQLVVFDGYVF